MLFQNNIDLKIHEFHYNKTTVQEDGITQIVDPKEYTGYQLNMGKIYFIEEKEEVVEEIIKDLQSTIQRLRQMQQKDKGIEDDERQ